MRQLPSDIFTDQDYILPPDVLARHIHGLRRDLYNARVAFRGQLDLIASTPDRSCIFVEKQSKVIENITRSINHLDASQKRGMATREKRLAKEKAAYDTEQEALRKARQAKRATRIEYRAQAALRDIYGA